MGIRGTFFAIRFVVESFLLGFVIGEKIIFEWAGNGKLFRGFE